MPGQFLSPGAAAANAIEEFMLQREERARQARADRAAQEVHESKMKDAEEARGRQKMQDALDLEDRVRGRVKEQKAGMVIGDQFKPEFQAQAHAAGDPLRTFVEPPSPSEMSPPGVIQEMSPDGASGETPVAQIPAGSIRFAGSPVQAKEADEKAAREKFIGSLSSNQPVPGAGGTGAAQSAAARAVGLPMSAADFEPPVDRAKSAVVQEYEFYKAEEAAAGRQPLGFDAYQARDANRKRPAAQGSSAGSDARVNSRVARFDNSAAAKNFELISGNWERAKEIDENATGAPGASQDAMLIYTFAKTMDPASAVREGEYNTVQDWATAVLPKYGFKLKRMLSPAQLLTPDARKAIKGEIGKAYKAQRARYNKGVQTLGQDLKRIGGLNTQNWRDEIDEDDDTVMSKKTAADYIKQYGAVGAK